MGSNALITSSEYEDVAVETEWYSETQGNTCKDGLAVRSVQAALRIYETGTEEKIETDNNGARRCEF